MGEAAAKAGFPVLTSLAALLGVGGAVVAGLCWLSPRVFEDGDALRATGFTGSAALAAVVLSLLPVIRIARGGVMAIVIAYFVGAALRIVALLAVFVLAVAWMELPAGPALLGLVVYLPLMFLETALVGRYLWMQDGPHRSAAVNGATETPSP